jgi:glycosyltransferase involved in cell wall biosynthesis
MRLLFVHQFLGALGGAESDLNLTAREFQVRGHTAALAYLDRTGRNEETLKSNFSECFRLNASHAKSSVEKLLNEFDPDAIYFHSLPDLDALESILGSAIPVVRRVHDHTLYCMRGYKYNYLTREVCKRAASWRCVFPCLASVGRNHKSRLGLKWVSYRAKRKEIQLNRSCRRLLVYSRHHKEELLRNGFESRKVEIYPPMLSWTPSGKLSSFSDRNLILYVGQVIRGKGVDLLLQALAKIKMPFEALILGDGNHRPYCEQLCTSLGLDKRVQFCGFIPNDELKNYFLQACVLAVSSVWPEPFALVGQEAARFGLPVVAFDAGGISEWLINGENGHLVPWCDTTQFAQRIEQLLSDKEHARQLGQRGLALAEERYGSARQIDLLENMFLRVIDETQTKNNENICAKSVPEFCS